VYLIVKKRLYASVAAVAVLAAVFSIVLRTQSKSLAAGLAPSEALFGADQSLPLPASDGIMLIDAKRLLAELLPRALADDPSRLAQVNADIDSFKTRTGVDLRSFNQVAVSMRYAQPSPGITRLESVALANGKFDSGAIVAAGRLASEGKYREETYQGKRIFIFNLNERVKVLGLFHIKVNDLAISAIDSNTLALGSVERVRAAIDAARGTAAPGNNELIALATRDRNAVVGFGANLSPNVMRNLDFGNDEIAKNVSSIRQTYGSIGTVPNGFSILTVARTEKTDQARDLGDMLGGLKQLGSMWAATLPSAKRKLAQTAIDNLKITTQNNELKLSMELAQSDLTSIMHVLNRAE
jgi:hypothetical protein